PYIAELYSPRYCTGDTCHCYSYFGSGGARVFRTWCTSSYTGVGENACGFHGLYPICTMDNDFPWACYYVNGTWIEPNGRWATRCDGSKNEKLISFQLKIHFQ